MAKRLGKYEKYFATTNKLCKLAMGSNQNFHVLLRFHEIFLKLATIIGLMAKHPLKLGKYEN